MERTLRGIHDKITLLCVVCKIDRNQYIDVLENESIRINWLIEAGIEPYLAVNQAQNVYSTYSAGITGILCSRFCREVVMTDHNDEVLKARL